MRWLSYLLGATFLMWLGEPSVAQGAFSYAPDAHPYEPVPRALLLALAVAGIVGGVYVFVGAFRRPHQLSPGQGAACAVGGSLGIALGVAFCARLAFSG